MNDGNTPWMQAEGKLKARHTIETNQGSIRREDRMRGDRSDTNLFHFSGHGPQFPSSFPAKKKKDIYVKKTKSKKQKHLPKSEKIRDNYFLLSRK